MFWKLGSLSASSPVDAVLDKDNFTLEELLEEEEIIQECKALNSRLINFLRDRTQVEQLLRYIIEDPSEDADSRRTFRFPFVACEVFACEIDVILRTLVEEEELMDLLFSFLDPNRPHSPLLSGYFSKVVVSLMLRKTVPLMNYVEAHQDIIRQLVDLIGITSIMEVLVRLVGADDHVYPSYLDVIQWLSDSNLLEMIVDKLSSSSPPEVQANAAETLCSITRNAGSSLATKLSSPSFVVRILGHALEESHSRSGLVHSLSVCISLLDPRKSFSSWIHSVRGQHMYEAPITVNVDTVNAMLPKLGDLLLLLNLSTDDKVLPMPYGELRPPLGKHRLKVAVYLLRPNLYFSDVNGNVAAASVKIFILSIPPQFVSVPAQLKAMEDFISPRFGGFHGFEIIYPDPQENISVTLNAKFGTVSLYPMLVNFWKPSWNGFSVSTGDEEAKSLVIMGHLEVINTVLKSIQYLGNENFFGEDVIRMSISNENEANDVNITVSVDPVNDPPYIHAPEYIVLEYNGNGKGSSIYNKEKNEFEFVIGDPDLSNLPGDKSQFLVMLSMEVDSGALEATLPAELINTTELKLKKNHHWQPLQTYVSISKHLKVKSKGLRFHATLNECNSVIQLLKFHGEEDGAVLTLSVNDLGNYGCNADCSENVSRPLFVEAKINLLNRRPMNSLSAYALGAAIVIELVMILSLGVALLSLTCKCVMSLIDRQGASKINKDSSSPKTQTCSERTKVWP